MIFVLPQNVAKTREEKLAYQKQYQITNKDAISERKRLRRIRERALFKEIDQNGYTKRKEQVKAYSKAHRANNPQYYADYQKAYRAVPKNKIARNYRIRIYGALKGKYLSKSLLALLGCDKAQFMEYLALKFRDGMTWENYGKVWHVDHIKPCAAFDLTNDTELRECFHHTNLQPLLAHENLSKGKKFLA